MSATMPKEEQGEASADLQNVEQPTAFILKLFDMINGAPDEVIAVSSSTATSESDISLELPE